MIQLRESHHQSQAYCSSYLDPNTSPPHKFQQRKKTFIMPKKQSIKNQIRNINRFLRKKGADLDEATKQDQQRKIEALERQIAGKVVKKKEQKLATKYHMVKFFEKKKVLRKIKKAQKAIQAADTTSSSSTSSTSSSTRAAASAAAAAAAAAAAKAHYKQLKSNSAPQADIDAAKKNYKSLKSAAAAAATTTTPTTTTPTTTTPTGETSLEQDLQTAQDQLIYIDYFPKDHKYVSLFVKDDLNDADNQKAARLKATLLERAKKRKAEEEQKAATKVSTKNERDYDDEVNQSGDVDEKDNFFM